jgi:hypothetical protein
VAHAPGARRDDGTTHVEVLAAPDLPRNVAHGLVDQLPELLERQHEGRWHVTLAPRPLLAGREGLDAILDVGSEVRRDERCDAVICLTDIPLRHGAQPLVAAVDRRDKVVVANVPAFGAVLVALRVRTAATALIDELTEEALEEPSEARSRLGAHRLAHALAPVHRSVVSEERAQVRYVMPTGTGHLRMLGGMVRANRPWRAFSGLSSAVVAAFATGAYALLSPTIWQLSGELGWLRLLAIMLCAVVAMVAWLVIGHDLWEKAEDSTPRKDAALYNTATTLTLVVAVLCGYAALFVLIFVVGSLMVEGGVFEANAGHAAGIGAYAALAWLGAAIGTVAGALGSKLESIEEVRYATYGHDQNRRRESDDDE